MANRLKMAKVQSILTLRERGWSARRIARALGIDRGTVLRHLRVARAPNAANAPPGSDAADGGVNADSGGSNAANAPTGSGGRTSDCEPYRAFIADKLERGLTTV
jgi:hypothetical protein